MGAQDHGLEEQSNAYATAALKWVSNSKPLPFVYESTGEVTRFTNRHDPVPRSREVFSFPRPETIQEWVAQPDPLRRRLREAIDFISRNYLKETVIKHPHQPEAERLWNFPLAAIEEALVNAIYHRSYEEREPVEVRITPQELAILSFPGADRSIRMADLQAGHADRTRCRTGRRTRSRAGDRTRH